MISPEAKTEEILQTAIQMRFYPFKIRTLRRIDKVIPEPLAWSLLILLGVVAFFVFLVNLWPSTPYHP